MSLESLNKFRAVYCNGLLIENQSTVAALGLLFESVYLPNNLEIVIEFAKRYRFIQDVENKRKVNISPVSSGPSDPFEALSKQQRATALHALDSCMRRAQNNHALFDEVFQTDAFEGSGPMRAKLIKEGGLGELNKYEVSMAPLIVVSEENEKLPSLIQSGYVPVLGSLHSFESREPQGTPSAKSLAALLAIKSVEAVFPAARPVPAEVILEARDKLGDQLNLFWAAMFTLSTDLRNASGECSSTAELSAVGVDIVDTLVRPALTDLNHKIELERKQWFHRVFGVVFKSLRVAAANPPLTQGQLLRNSLTLGADAAMAAVGRTQKVRSLKDEAGLAYLLDLSSLADNT